MKKNLIVDLTCLLLLLLFAYAATSKLVDYHKFVFQMNLAPVPLMGLMAPMLAWLVPVTELVVMVALAIGFFDVDVRIKALYTSVILLSIFELYITAMLLSGLHLPCTCGGIISKLSWKQHLLFNGFFIIAGSWSIFYLKKHSAIPSNHNGIGYNKLSRA